MSKVLFFFVLSLKSSRKDFSDLIKPIFPATGSIMTAAKSFFTVLKAFRNAFSSLYGTEIVYFANSSGIPGESGNPKVETPEPAFISREST